MRAGEQARPDLTLVLPALALWGGAFTATGTPARWPVVAATALVLPLPLVARRRRATATLLLLGLSAGLALGGLRVLALRSGPVPALATDGAAVDVEGVVTADPRRLPRPAAARGPVPVLARVRLEAVRTAVDPPGAATRVRSPVLVLAEGRRWADLLPGQRVALTGRLQPPREGWSGQPIAAVLDARGPPRLLGDPPAVQRAAGRLRQGLRDAVAGLPADQRGLVPGLVVGDTAAMPADLTEQFRTAGLTHLNAVSGANLAIVTGFVLLAGRWLGLRGLWLPALAVVAMAGFVVLARPEPSVLRAAVMGSIGLAALATGRRRRSAAALSAAVVLLLLVDPWLARSYGFALSVLATAGLLMLAPGWAGRLAGRGVPLPLAQALAVPLAAQVCCAPLLVLLAGEVSLVAVPANLLAAPAVAPATVLGVTAVLASAVHDAPAALAAHLAGVPAGWIALVARRAARAPFAAVSWPATVPGALGLAAVLVLLGLVGRRLARRPWAVAAAVAALLGGALGPAAAPGWPPPGWVLVACDVGQGDALVLNAGAGSGVVVDAGPDPAAADRCLRDLGIDRVPLVLLTHLHADHVEGLPGVLRGRAVGEVRTGAYDEPAGERSRVAGWLRGAAVPFGRVVVGERARVGPLRWRVLWPHRVIGQESVANNASVVLLVRVAGLRLLLTGDVEPPAQRALLARWFPQSGVDVLKVPHHGSAYQDPALLAATRPRLALVSVGAGNDYGHPAPATVRTLARAGALVARTDRDGPLAVVGDRDRLRLVTR